MGQAYYPYAKMIAYDSEGKSPGQFWEKPENNGKPKSLDYSITQEMKDHSMAELLIEKVFGSEE